MIWPFRNILHRHRAGPLAHRAANDAKDLFYVSRTRIEKAIADALAQGDNLVVYGPSHQGKTMLLTRQLAADSIYIECRPGFKRTQIYRVVLSSLGYAVLVEKKRRGKASTTVKFGLASTGVEASAEGEMEQVLQSVTVDLKNPSEVAHLISRIKQVPQLVLNNFQLLDRKTKRSLLFDLAFFAERSSIHTFIVGTWSNEDYLEEIEPAVAGKFRYALVPTWSDAELHEAAAQWSARSKAFGEMTPHLNEFLALVAGDISLFRALLENSIDNNSRSSPSGTVSTPTVPDIQSMVLGRFRRGLSTKLKAIFAHRDTYVTYYYLETTSRFEINPKFHLIPNAGKSDYLETMIDPYTNRPYSNGHTMLLDRSGNPQYIEQTTGEVDEMQTDIASFLLRKFHSAVQQGSSKIELASLVNEFEEQLLPKPIALDKSRLKTVFVRFGEVQRQALIIPHMLAVDGAGEAMEIVDRRLFLFLQSVGPEDLEELLDESQPRNSPSARRRSRLSPKMTAEEKDAYVEQVMPEPQKIPNSDELIEDEPDDSDSNEAEPDEDESGINEEP